MYLPYKMSETFYRIHQDKTRHIFIMGPYGSGKSSGCIWHAVLNAMRQPAQRDGVRRSKHLVVRSTYPELYTTTMRSWKEWFKENITLSYGAPGKGMLKFDLPDGTKLEMELIFLAMDDEDSSRKVRSLDVTSAHINEADQISRKAYDEVRGRINRYPARKDSILINPFIICDYNPVNTEHWLYKLAEVEKPEEYAFYRQPPAILEVGGKFIVNPKAENLEHHQEGYYDALMQGASEDYIRVNLMNNYGDIRAGRVVFKDYNDFVHPVPKEKVKPLLGVPLIIGIDQGLTPSAVLTQMAPDGSILVLDEIVTEDCSLHEFCTDYLWPLLQNKYRAQLRDYILVVDPAAAQRSMNDAKSGVEVFREHGFKVKMAYTNTFTTRKEAVSYFLRKINGFKLSDRCATLRRGFISDYMYEESKTVNGIQYKEKPSKNNVSHVHDALQYAVLEYYKERDKKRKVFKGNLRKPYRAASTVAGY